jgi:hypothetical protein
MVIPKKRKCTKCGKKKKLDSEFRNQVNGKYGKQSACKECVKLQLREYRKTPEGKAKHREYQRKHRKTHGCIEKRKGYRRTPEAVWKTYKYGAEKRNLLFSIPIEEFVDRFWEKPCTYCGDPIETAGIDRIDNSAGYTALNTVPCCSTCNFMKRDMKCQDFLNHCKRVASLVVMRD